MLYSGFQDPACSGFHKQNFFPDSGLHKQKFRILKIRIPLQGAMSIIVQKYENV